MTNVLNIAVRHPSAVYNASRMFSACAVFTSGVSLEVTLAVLTITTIPIVLEARKSLEKDRGEKEGDSFRALPFL